MDRVVITGMGTINPLGLTVEESWKNAINGVSGVGPITLFDSTPLNVHFAAEVKNFEPGKYMDPKEARRRDRFEQFGAAAAKDALASSGPGDHRSQCGTDRCACFFCGWRNNILAGCSDHELHRGTAPCESVPDPDVDAERRGRHDRN